MMHHAIPVYKIMNIHERLETFMADFNQENFAFNKYEMYCE